MCVLGGVRRLIFALPGDIEVSGTHPDERCAARFELSAPIDQLARLLRLYPD